MVQKTILDVKELQKSYGKIKALKGVSFDIPVGKIAGLVGPNGSGKTTLIKCINGFHKYKGTIKLMEKNISKVDKTHIGYLGEGKNYYPYLTGKEYLQFFANLYEVGHDEKIIQDNLNSVGLYGRKDDLIKTYSNGMKQRLGIARTLLQDPKLLIYDEPLAGLDPIIKHEISQIIRGVSKKGITTLISSHQLKDIEGICNWVILINKGKIIDFGLPVDILERTNPVKDIVLTVDEKSVSTIVEIKNDLDFIIDVIVEGNTVIFTIEDKKRTESKIFQWMISRDIDFSLKHGSLDSMYRSVFK